MNEGCTGLIEDCLTGDETAIARFIEEHQFGVFRLALSILSDPGEANEATQDTFILALKAMNTYREQAKLKSWLFKIALNTSRSRLRKRNALERLHHRLAALFRAQEQHVPTPEDIVVAQEKDGALWQALERLGEKHRVPIVLRYYHDFSIAEIATILNIKEGTVHSRLSIAREKLRSELAGFINPTGE